MQTNHVIVSIGLLLGATAFLARLVFDNMRGTGKLRASEAPEERRDHKRLRMLEAPISAALTVVYGFTLIVFIYALFVISTG